MNKNIVSNCLILKILITQPIGRSKFNKIFYCVKWVIDGFLGQNHKDIALPTNRGIKTKGNIYEVYSQLGSRNLPISVSCLFKKGKICIQIVVRIVLIGKIFLNETYLSPFEKY